MQRPLAVDCLPVGGQFQCFIITVRSGAAGNCSVKGRKFGVGVDALDCVRGIVAACVDKAREACKLAHEG